MALLVLGGLAYYYWANKPQPNHSLSQQKPTSVAQLAPMDRLHPSKNDMIRPPSWTYDPRKIGFTSSIRSNVRGDYPDERYLSDQSVSKENALWKRQDVRDIYVQQQTAYWTDHPFLEPQPYGKRSVFPHPRIKPLGNPRYTRYVPPPKSSPV